MSSRTRNYSIRLSAEGKRQLEADLRSLGTAGERSLKAIQAASRPASAGLQATDRAARDLRGGLRAVAGEVPAVQRLTRLLGTTALAGGMVALGRSALDVGRQFQAAMKRVEAVTNAPAAALERLADAARQTGASTAFTAQQAADAIEVLAKNGLDTEAILQGALRATVNLAGGLGSELAPSADLVTDIMQQFNLSAAELPEVADAVAGAALTSKFGFDDLRLAIGQAGGVVGQFGGDYREFLAALSATASGFASGSDAGTSFKNFLQRLTPQSKQAAAAMEELGLEFYAADGTMKSMVEIAAELQAATEGLSAEARNSSFQTIFGTDAIRTALLLADQGAEGLRDLGRALGEVSAEEQAQVRLEGLDGALKELTAAWEALQLTSAENGGLDLAEAAVTRLTEALRYLEENFAEVEEIAERVGQALVTFLVGRGITLAVAKAVAMRAAYIELAGAVTGVGTAASRAIGPMTRLGAAGRVLIGTLGGPLSLAITAASVAALAIDFDSASDAVERADAATAGATSALEAYREASRLAAEEQKNLGGEISAATREMLTQSEAELLRLIPQAERELQRARETFLSNGWGSGDARGVRETLEAPNAAAMKRVDLGFSTVEEELQGRGLNQYLFGLQEVFAAFERGEAPIADFLEELARLERIPPHFTDISAAMIEMLDAGQIGSDAFDALSSEMIELARTAGLFERELAAIDAAQTRTERNRAIHELAGALSDASAAGLHLREELTEQQREVMGGIADTSAALEGLNEDYQANSDLAGEIEGTRPFDDVGESAKEAAEQVARLSEAYETYRSAGSEGFWQTDRGAYPREELEVARKGILDLIGFVEGTDKGRGYNETLGYGAFTGGPVNLVNMSLNRVRTLQDEMLRHPDNTYNSSAVGRYQIVGRTLQSLMDRLDLSGDELFSAELQDRLAMELVRGRMGQGKSGFYAEWEGFKKAGTPWRTIQEALGQDSIPAIDPEVEKAREDSQEKRAEARREEAETLARLVAIGDDQIAQLELEAELTGKSAEEQAYLAAMFEMLTAAKRAGIDPEKQLAEDGRRLIEVYREQARAIAERTAAQERDTDRTAEEEERLRESKDAVRSAFDNLKPGGEGPKAFIEDLTGFIADKLWELALDPVWDMLAQLMDSVIQGLASSVGGTPAPAPASAPANADGGPIGYAGGGALQVGGRAAGRLRGTGGKRQDNILFWGSPGEFMQPAAAVDYYGQDFMEAVRQRRLPRYADGGALLPQASAPMAAGEGGGPGGFQLHIHEGAGGAETRVEGSPGAGRMDIFTRSMMTETVRGGGLDAAMRDRYGVKPRARR